MNAHPSPGQKPLLANHRQESVGPSALSVALPSGQNQQQQIRGQINAAAHPVNPSSWNLASFIFTIFSTRSMEPAWYHRMLARSVVDVSLAATPRHLRLPPHQQAKPMQAQFQQVGLCFHILYGCVATPISVRTACMLHDLHAPTSPHVRLHADLVDMAHEDMINPTVCSMGNHSI